MVRCNPHYQKLQSGYLFPEIEKRYSSFKHTHPSLDYLHLGVGDVSLPLVPSVVDAIIKATKEMGEKHSYRGYGPSEGYPFLRETISLHDYEKKISPEEIFISDGTKNDMGHFQELFATKNRVALCDPSYPVYIDVEVMAGRSGTFQKKTKTYKNFLYLPCLKENDFVPELPKQPVDLIYFCSPNNPTGKAFSRKDLQKWVSFAQKEKALLLFDGAYQAFITSPDVPKSIYEIPGAEEVAVEFRSFSKTAGFTGLRCSYTVVPKKIFVGKVSLHSLWKRRMQTKFGGTPYPIQRGAEAIYSPQGKKEIQKDISLYLENASFLKNHLKNLSFEVFGGIDAPFVWCQTPNHMDSWDFFDLLLEKAQIISTPGAGFGPSGKHFVRFSCFAPKQTIEKAIEKLKTL